MAIKYNYKKNNFFFAVHIYGKQKSKIKKQIYQNQPQFTVKQKKIRRVLLKYSYYRYNNFRISNVIANQLMKMSNQN